MDADLVDAGGGAARGDGDGDGHVVQVKVHGGLVLDVDVGLGARGGGPAVDEQGHAGLCLGLWPPTAPRSVIGFLKIWS